jgi:hypothetical protein
MCRIWLRLTWISASLAAWASTLKVQCAEPSSSRATIVPSARVSTCPGGACLARARIRLRSRSVNLGSRASTRPHPLTSDPFEGEPLQMDARRLRMATRLGGDLIGRLASQACAPGILPAHLALLALLPAWASLCSLSCLTLLSYFMVNEKRSSRVCPRRLQRQIGMDGLLRPDTPFQTEATDIFI